MSFLGDLEIFKINLKCNKSSNIFLNNPKCFLTNLIFERNYFDFFSCVVNSLFCSSIKIHTIKKEQFGIENGVFDKLRVACFFVAILMKMSYTRLLCSDVQNCNKAACRESIIQTIN